MSDHAYSGLTVEGRMTGDGERVEFGVWADDVFVPLNAVQLTWFEAAQKDAAEAAAHAAANPQA
jgi:hypothetical protein